MKKPNAVINKYTRAIQKQRTAEHNTHNAHDAVIKQRSADWTTLLKAAFKDELPEGGWEPGYGYVKLEGYAYHIRATNWKEEEPLCLGTALTVEADLDAILGWHMSAHETHGLIKGRVNVINEPRISCVADPTCLRTATLEIHRIMMKTFPGADHEKRTELPA